MLLHQLLRSMRSCINVNKSILRLPLRMRAAVRGCFSFVHSYQRSSHYCEDLKNLEGISLKLEQMLKDERMGMCSKVTVAAGMQVLIIKNTQMFTRWCDVHCLIDDQTSDWWHNFFFLVIILYDEFKSQRIYKYLYCKPSTKVSQTDNITI